MVLKGMSGSLLLSLTGSNVRFLAAGLLAVLITIAASCSPSSPKSLEDESNRTASPNSDFSTKQASGWPFYSTDLMPDKRVTYGTLSNGLRYAVLSAESKDEIVSIQASVDVGLKDEDSPKYGIAHLLEHLVFRMSDETSERSVVHEFQSVGASFGLDLNGLTSFDETLYRVNLTNPTQSNVQDALSTFSRMISNPDLSEATIEIERGVVIAEYHQRNSVAQQAARSKLAFMYADRERFAHPGTGTPTSIASIQAADLASFHQEYYRPENTLIIVTGGIDTANTIEAIEQYFGEWEPAPDTNRRVGDTTQVDAARLSEFPSTDQFYHKDLNTNFLAVQNTLSSWSEDTLAFREKEIVTEVTDALFRERLRAAADEDKAVSWFSLQTELSPNYDLKSVTMGAKSLAYYKAIKLFEIERLSALEYGFEEAELERELKRKRARLKRRVLEFDQIDAWWESNRLRNALRDQRVYVSRNEELELFDQLTDRLKLSDYQASFSENWKAFEPRFWIQSASDANRTLEKVKEARREILEHGVARRKPVISKPFNSVDLSSEGQVLERKYDRKFGLSRLLWSNGVRLNYVQSGKGDGKLSIALNIKGDVFLYADHYAAMAEWASAFSAADIEGETKTGIRNNFAGQNVDFSIGLEGEALKIRLETDKADLGDALKVLTAFLINHDLDSEDHKRRLASRQSRQESNAKSSPAFTGLVSLPYLLSKKSSEYRTHFHGHKGGTRYFENALSDYLDEGSLEVGAYGDFDPEELERIFSQTLGALPERRPVKPNYVPESLELKMIAAGVQTQRYDGNKDQMALFYCWPHDYSWDQKLVDSSYHQIAFSALQNRMHGVLRDELGQTYSFAPFSTQSPIFKEINASCLGIQHASDQEVAIRKNMTKLLDEIRSTPVDKDEFDRAKQPVLSVWKRIDNLGTLQAIFLSGAFSEPDRYAQYIEYLRSLETIKLRKFRPFFEAAFRTEDLRLIRVQADEKEADFEFRRLNVDAELGNAKAQYDLGKILQSRGETDNQKLAYSWIQKAADQGYAPALIDLGIRERSRASKKEAAEFFKKAESDPDGLFELAELYYVNPKTFPNVTNAEIMTLYRRSAEGGSRSAKRKLAMRYREGAMVERDEVEALKWMLLARNSFNKPQMDQELLRYARNLTESEILEARSRARLWAKDWLKDN